MLEADVFEGLEFGLPEEDQAGPEEITPELIEGARLFLAEDLAQLPAEEIESVLREIMAELGPENSRVLQTVGGLLGALAPAVGGLVGGRAGRAISTIGGLGGTVLGAVGGATGRPQTRSTTRPAARPSGHRPTTRTSGTTAATVARMMSNPTVLQGLGSLLSGGRGRGTISLGRGGPQIPVGALTNMLSQLLNRASMEAHLLHGATSSAAEEIPEYLLDESGEPIVSDPANPLERADAVVALLDRYGPDLPETGDLDDHLTGSGVEGFDEVEEDFFEAEGGDWEEDAWLEEDWEEDAWLEEAWLGEDWEEDDEQVLDEAV
jgi:hypothetical protein